MVTIFYKLRYPISQLYKFDLPYCAFSVSLKSFIVLIFTIAVSWVGIKLIINYHSFSIVLKKILVKQKLILGEHKYYWFFKKLNLEYNADFVHVIKSFFFM